MNKNYLPFYNSLNEKEKAFWLECTKEELIDHLIGNIKNGETLLNRIDKAIEYITSYESADTLMSYENKENNKGLDEKTMIEINRRYLIIQGKLLEILGDKENE